MSTRPSAGIPRLQELQFVEVALDSVIGGSTFDQIRQGLFSHMQYTRRENAPSGNHAGLRRQEDPATRYVHNTSEALTELMRLGYVERGKVPSSKRAAESYRDVTFTATATGAAWARLNAENPVSAYDELLKQLIDLHPQLRGYLGLLGEGPIIIPTAKWSEVHDRPVGAEQAEAARAEYVAFLADRCARAIEAIRVGWIATRGEIHEAIIDYIAARVASATSRSRPHPYPRAGDFVGAVEEALASFAFTRAGMPLDYISLEILRRWTKTLGVAGFSYHVPGPPALRLWPTAEITSPPQLTISRRTGEQWTAAVLRQLPDAYERARQQQRDRSFVPVHLVRAAVCSSLGLNENVFDTAIRQCLALGVESDLPYRLNLDRAQFGALPPSERPLLVPDRQNRMRAYSVMTLVNRPERTSA